MSARIPDFFVVGHPKSGTTALYEMLKRHPQIFMPDLKEPRFLASDLHARFAPTGSSAVPSTLEEYLALFAPAQPGQRVGEASPSYLRSRVAAAAIAELQPEARIIAILREPADFLRSLHLELLQNRVESEPDLRRALAAEGVAAAEWAGGGAGQADEPMLRYTDRVRYVEQLGRFRERFAEEQMLVLIYDDFRRENEQTVRRVLRFLEVDDGVPVQSIEANPTVGLRSRRADDLLRSLYAGSNPAARLVKATATRILPPRARSELLPAIRRRLVYGKPPPADTELMRDLRRRFKGEVIALGEYLDRDLLELWGYTELD
jgi:hypothetical protein